jgi:hypothetical protein
MQRITDRIAHEWAERNNLEGVPTSTLRVAIEDARSIPELERSSPEQSETEAYLRPCLDEIREAFDDVHLRIECIRGHLVNAGPLKFRPAPPPSEQAGISCGTCNGTGLANVVDQDDGALVIDDCPECGGESAFPRGVGSDCTCPQFGCKQHTFAHPAPEAQAEGEPAVSWHGRMPDALREWLVGMAVSVDVSTDDATANQRYFGTITEVMDARSKHGVILLVQDAKPNFAIGPSGAFRCRNNSGEKWRYIDDRAPDSYELRECEIESLYLRPQPSASETPSAKDSDVPRITEDALIGHAILPVGTPCAFVVSMAQAACKRYRKTLDAALAVQRKEGES